MDSTIQFDRTQKNLDELILQLKQEVYKAEPIIENLIKASSHLENILGSLNNPKTLNSIKETADSTRSITNKVDTLTNGIGKLSEDEKLMDALKNLTLGLSKFFNELYPESE